MYFNKAVTKYSRSTITYSKFNTNNSNRTVKKGMYIKPIKLFSSISTIKIFSKGWSTFSKQRREEGEGVALHVCFIYKYSCEIFER